MEQTNRITNWLPVIKGQYSYIFYFNNKRGREERKSQTLLSSSNRRQIIKMLPIRKNEMKKTLLQKRERARGGKWRRKKSKVQDGENRRLFRSKTGREKTAEKTKKKNLFWRLFFVSLSKVTFFAFFHYFGTFFSVSFSLSVINLFFIPVRILRLF